MSRHAGVLRKVVKQLSGRLEPAKTTLREGDMIMLARAELECGHVLERRRPIFGKARCFECKS